MALGASKPSNGTSRPAAKGCTLLGPNCLGFQRPALGLNAGTVGPLAQHRATGPGLAVRGPDGLHARLGPKNGVGFSSVISLGPRQRGAGQALDFLANDPQTQSILVSWKASRMPAAS